MRIQRRHKDSRANERAEKLHHRKILDNYYCIACVDVSYAAATINSATSPRNEHHEERKEHQESSVINADKLINHWKRHKSSLVNVLIFQ